MTPSCPAADAPGYRGTFHGTPVGLLRSRRLMSSLAGLSPLGPLRRLSDGLVDETGRGEWGRMDSQSRIHYE